MNRAGKNKIVVADAFDKGNAAFSVAELCERRWPGETITREMRNSMRHAVKQHPGIRSIKSGFSNEQIFFVIIEPSSLADPDRMSYGLACLKADQHHAGLSDGDLRELMRTRHLGEYLIGLYLSHLQRPDDVYLLSAAEYHVRSSNKIFARGFDLEKLKAARVERERLEAEKARQQAEALANWKPGIVSTSGLPATGRRDTPDILPEDASPPRTRREGGIRADVMNIFRAFGALLPGRSLAEAATDPEPTAAEVFKEVPPSPWKGAEAAIGLDTVADVEEPGNSDDEEPPLEVEEEPEPPPGVEEDGDDDAE